MPCFRAPTEDEVDVAYAAYRGGEFAHLCDVWKAHARAQRSTLSPWMQGGYELARVAPAAVNAHAFLASLRAVLDAGLRFRSGLSAPTRYALEHDFPWLEKRHQHIPPGWTPRFDFPVEFADWIDVPQLEEAKARWQLAASLNEVQQAHNSEDSARRFGLPPLRIHATRERELAINYLGHDAPAVTRALFRECLFLLDALNAAVFDMLCVRRPGEMVRYAVAAAFTERAQWRTFVDGLAQPQWLLPLA